ncbi:TIGR01777 family oxidoreductase [uncultured Nitrospira sp.]|uniref:TIGR01777 family oxidoreductase n=1 Tax=uncultured Nitrospira sp. TaxID=157176 RepID=UPI003140B54E
MKIVIAGGTGFIGREVCRVLTKEGHFLSILTRHAGDHTASASPRTRFIQWDGVTPGPWVQKCEGADVVINLSGAPIADSRWTDKRKQVLIDSRVQPIQALLLAISSWKHKPHTFISASGIGIYGARGEEELDESSTPGQGFLSDLSQVWENTAMEGAALGLRVIPIRFGMVLGPDGGALSKMTLPFRLFLGGPVLPGTQYVSWIHRNDLARLILFVITHPTLDGPINGVAPKAATMQEFCTTLGKTMNRPSWFPVPEFLLNIALGELATMLTTGQRVHPQKALKGGFSFSHPNLQEALHLILDKPATQGT